MCLFHYFKFSFPYFIILSFLNHFVFYRVLFFIFYLFFICYVPPLSLYFVLFLVFFLFAFILHVICSSIVFFRPLSRPFLHFSIIYLIRSSIALFRTFFSFSSFFIHSLDHIFLYRQFFFNSFFIFIFCLSESPLTFTTVHFFTVQLKLYIDGCKTKEAQQMVMVTCLFVQTLTLHPTAI